MQLTEVNPSDIERELQRAWREAAEIRAEQINSTDPAPQVRTILSNFVILSFDRAQDRALDELVTALCITNPSRFFIVRFSNESSGELKTFVSSRCVLARSGNHVCSEEVHLRVSPETAYLVPNLLFSLFAADVPVVLMTVGDALGDPSLNPKFKEFFAALRTQGDLVLFDSSHARLFGRATLSYLGLRDVIRVRDLSWYRSERWRVLVAEQFDSERFLDGLERISQLKFSCGATPAQLQGGEVPSEALLLAGWIASALGWHGEYVERLHGGEVLRLHCLRADGKGRIALDFVSNHGKGSTSSVPLSQLQIVIDEAVGPLALEITREPSQGVAAITVEHGDAPVIETTKKEERANFCDFSVLRVPFRVPADEDLVLQPIYSTGEDPTYFRAAQMAAELSLLLSK